MQYFISWWTFPKEIKENKRKYLQNTPLLVTTKLETLDPQLLLFFIISFALQAQQKIDDVDYKYDKAFLEGLIQEQIDAFRQSEGLPVFKHDEVLTMAAEDQTAYIIKTRRVSHNQPSLKKATPFKRVMFYDGMHSYVGENCYSLIVGTMAKLPGESEKTKLKSYHNVATAIAQNWIQLKGGAEIISDAKYVNYGISVVLNEVDKSLVATHVVGSEPFVLPEGVKPMKGDFGILPYDKSKCAEINKKYGYLPQLMSDNIFFKNGQIYFYFHDLALIKSVLNETGDGISLDILTKDQFECGSGNKLYPSKVHSGIMLEPI